MLAVLPLAGVFIGLSKIKRRFIHALENLTKSGISCCVLDRGKMIPIPLIHANMALQTFIGGTHGHEYAVMVDSKPRDVRVDRRVHVSHIGARTNVRDREHHRSDVYEGQTLDGTLYSRTRTCTECHRTFHKSKFGNYAVAERARGCNGLNIRCRGCQARQYCKGYLIDGFIVDDEEN